MSQELETMKKLINAEAFNLGEPAYSAFKELSENLLAEFHEKFNNAEGDANKAAVLFAYSKFCMDLQEAMEAI